MKKIAVSLLAAAVSVSAMPAMAQQKDFEVAARTFKFIDGAPSGSATVGIVDDGGNAEAQALAAWLGGGQSVAGLTLKGKIVSPSDISGVDLVFVPKGLPGSHASVAAAAKQFGLLTITTDMACVESKNCVMAVQAEPKVSIVVSRSATNDAGLSLNEALKMMVQERD